MTQTRFNTDHPSILRLWVRRVRDRVVGQLIRFKGKKSLSVYGLEINIDNDQIAHRELSHLARGIYEINEIKNIEKYLTPDCPVIELGGSLGVVACFCNQRLQDPTQHVVVEAHPTIATLLESNRERNQCQFKIVQAAVAYGEGKTTWLYEHESHTASSVSDVSGQAIEVPTTQLSTLFEEFGFEEAVLLCDIEGMEYDLVQQEANLLSERVRLIIMDIHERQLSPEQVDQLLETLEAGGFELIDNISNVIVLRNNRLIS